MKKQIVIDTDCRDFLMDVFGCSRMAVWRAMTFESDSDKSRRLRHLALQRGGELVGAELEEGDTTHEEVEKTMTQHFGKRVKLVYHKPTGDITVYVDGKIERTACGVKAVPAFVEFQKDIQLLAASL